MNNTSGTSISNPVLGSLGKLSGSEFFQKAIPAAVGVGFVVGALIFLFMLIWGAIEWISSGGDKQHLESARGRITNALVGIVVLFASYAILVVIGNFFHIDILNLKIPGLSQ